jgi:excisionase family DNA binding protein
MNISTRISPQIINAAVALLSASIPELSAAKLIDALKTYDGVGSPHAERPERPYTRKEAAQLLGVSLPTIDRYMASGRLKRVRFSAHAVRIAPESVRALLDGAGDDQSGTSGMETTGSTADVVTQAGD